MSVRRCLLATVAVGALAVSPGAGSAQEIGSTAPNVSGNSPEHPLDRAAIGPITFDVGGEAQLEYNSNVFAEPDDAASDAIAIVRPYANIRHKSGSLTTVLATRFDLRRHADFTSEDADAASVRLTSDWSPRAGESLFVSGHVDRVIETRGDPESRRIQGIGPRLYRIMGGSAGYSRSGSRFLLEAVGEAQNVNALAARDADRDYDLYSGRVTLGVRPGGPFYFTGTGYYTRRDFKLREPVTNADRDVSTLGALLGVRFADGGLIEGRVGAGVFRVEADDPARDSRTGFSLQGRLTYRPRQRTAIILDLFNGDVTSFRTGASTRTETNIGLGVDQEIRHNLLGSARVRWERVEFEGSTSPVQQRWQTAAEVEYLANRRFSLFGEVAYGSRSSDDPLDEYDRFRGGVGVRMRF